MSAPILPPLYAIVDAAACAAAGRDPIELAAAYLRGGATLLQLRAKTASGAEFLRLADQLSSIAAAAGATLIVNDRVDVARTVGAGVHLGQLDLPPAVARRLLGPAAMIGVSTHDATQVAAALREPIDYLAIGPVFVTRTKDNPDPVVGLKGVQEAARLARAATLPLVAIGGIRLENASSVLKAGADSVAIIGDLLAGADGPEARVRAFLSIADP